MLSCTSRIRVATLDVIRGRSLASSSAFADYIPDSFRSAVKESALEEITRDDSKLWGSGGQNGYNKSKLNGDQNIRHLDGGINDNISIGLEDDLSQWYLDVKPRYNDDTTNQIKNNNNADPFILSKPFLERLDESIRNDLVSTDHPVLQKAASYFFSPTASSGKKVRPMMVLLLSQALQTSGTSGNTHSKNASRLEEQQYRLAEISEMIHTASLFHDDVIDGADTRRGKYNHNSLVLNVFRLYLNLQKLLFCRKSQCS